MPQMQLPFFPDGATEINANIGVIKEGDQVTYIYGHLPVFTHDVKDVQSFRMITSQLYINGTVKQSDICRVFGVTSISVKRSVKLYRNKGIAGFYAERRKRGAAVLTSSVLEKAQQLLDEGFEVKEVANQLDLKKDTLRKAVTFGRLHKVEKKKLSQRIRSDPASRASGV